ncbi:hypothetical protein [Ramlibacter sp. PS4R-6]|uniref:hypothetical protein n=1 Tax=Ramlibacter sp. PS4R-6 TaxID=3133438 RepID=UPI0030B79837
MSAAQCQAIRNAFDKKFAGYMAHCNNYVFTKDNYRSAPLPPALLQTDAWKTLVPQLPVLYPDSPMEIALTIAGWRHGACFDYGPAVEIDMRYTTFVIYQGQRITAFDIQVLYVAGPGDLSLLEPWTDMTGAHLSNVLYSAVGTLNEPPIVADLAIRTRSTNDFARCVAAIPP